MSADKKMDIEVITDHGPVHSVVRGFAAKVAEQPAVRVTRQHLVEAFQDDPKMAGAIQAIKENIKKGSTVFIVGAEVSSQNGQASIKIEVRFEG